MNKTITIALNPESIDAAIKELDDYMLRIRTKTQELARRIADHIRDEADAGFQSAVADDLLDGTLTGSNVTVTTEENGDVLVIIAQGSLVTFVEFGAGVYYNGSAGESPHPLGQEMGFLIGEYGSGYGKKTTWGFYGSDGEFHLTHGTPAAMPMYFAALDAMRTVIELAQEVFAS